MADDSKSFSFTFTKKKDTKQLQKATVLGTEQGHKDDDDNVDFIRAAEGNQLQSVKPKEVIKELVIPLQKKNRWILPTNSLDKQAVEELVKDALKDLEAKDETNDDVSIPILMRNKLPDVEGYEQDVKLDIAMRPPESCLDDYESMPVSSFGAAMLRGMGWTKGEAIGGTVKGLCEPIEYIQRSKGLGLGAERKKEPTKKKRRKPGDVEEKKIGPIKEKDGRVRHIKGVGEKVTVEEPLDFQPGVGAVIEKGPHKHMHGKIISVDLDNSRVTVRLHISGENTTIHQYHVRLIDKKEYKDLSNDIKQKDKQKDSEYKSSKRRKGDICDDNDSKKFKHKDGSPLAKYNKSLPTSSTSNGDTPKESKSWLYPQLRVRIVSKDYKKGRYYNTKVRVLDVTGRNSCVCETQDGKVLEGVSQSMLETVVPKSENAYVRIVRGANKGQLGTLLRRDTSKYEAIVQLLADKNIVSLHYDDISEHLGDIRGDFL